VEAPFGKTAKSFGFFFAMELRDLSDLFFQKIKGLINYLV